MAPHNLLNSCTLREWSIKGSPATLLPKVNSRVLLNPVLRWIPSTSKRTEPQVFWEADGVEVG